MNSGHKLAGYLVTIGLIFIAVVGIYGCRTSASAEKLRLKICENLGGAEATNCMERASNPR